LDTSYTAVAWLVAVVLASGDGHHAGQSTHLDGRFLGRQRAVVAKLTIVVSADCPHCAVGLRITV
jgi:hypothetical protein